jgi:2-hydroxychromene-2-carboxylate isomerase
MNPVVTKLPEPRHLDFYFDVLCPFAWRTSLWMREVAHELDISVTWKQFSLAIGNQADPEGDFMRRDLALGRTFVAADRLGGNEGVDRLYLALGDVIHGQRLDPLDETIMRDALISAGHIPELMEAALNDPTTEDEYRDSHRDGESVGTFGVPTLVFDGVTPGHFGPVVDPVPTGADAVELWRVVSWVARQPYLWEMKKDRGGRRLEALRAPGLLLDAVAQSAADDDSVDACAWVPSQPAAR